MIPATMAYTRCRYWIWGVGPFDDPLRNKQTVIVHPEILAHIEQMDPSFANQPERWAIAVTVSLNDILLLKARHQQSLHDAVLRSLAPDPSRSVAW